MKKLRFFLVCALMITALLTVGLTASFLHNNKAFDRPAADYLTVATGDVFGTDGLPAGRSLDIDPLEVTAEHVIFSDRVLRLFIVDPESLDSGNQKISESMQNVPAGIDKYLLIAPTRITFEDESIRQFSGDELDAIGDSYSAMPSDVKTVDIAAVLAAHSGEYLFFRTDPRWTSIAAYYAAGAFCEAAGIPPPDISAYREYHFIDYVGTLRTIASSGSFRMVPDHVAYHLSDGVINEQTITARISSGEYITYRSPTVSQARMYVDIFVGGYFSHSIIDGNAGNGKVLMIVGDDYAKAFSTWMVPCFEKIVLVNPLFFSGSDSDFMRLFKDHAVTEFLILENAQNLGDSIFNNWIHRLFTESKPE
jgi:hypothetical protein